MTTVIGINKNHCGVSSKIESYRKLKKLEIIDLHNAFATKDYNHALDTCDDLTYMHASTVQIPVSHLLHPRCLSLDPQRTIIMLRLPVCDMVLAKVSGQQRCIRFDRDSN